MTTTVPFYDLAGLHSSIADDIALAISRTIAGNHLVLGPECEAFEAEFARHCGAGHAVGVGNGLDALRLGRDAMGIETGVHYPTPPHLTGAYSESHRTAHLPNSRLWARDELSLPIGPMMSDSDIDRVAFAMLDAVAGCSATGELERSVAAV